jgi:hypothetical protein
MINLTYEDAVKFAREAVAEQGEDFVYDSEYRYRGQCVYAKRTVDGNVVPSCLVGVVLAKAGLDMNLMVADSGTRGGPYAYGGASAVIALMREAGHIQASPKAVEFLTHAQCEQDAYETWGAAISTAIRISNSE